MTENDALALRHETMAEWPKLKETKSTNLTL